MIFGTKMNSTSFTWNRYCGQRGVSIYYIFGDDDIFTERYKCLGWCFANTLPVKSKDTGIAVMLWDECENNKVWCHISGSYLDTLIKKYKLQNKIEL